MGSLLYGTNREIISPSRSKVRDIKAGPATEGCFRSMEGSFKFRPVEKKAFLKATGQIARRQSHPRGASGLGKGIYLGSHKTRVDGGLRMAESCQAVRRSRVELRHAKSCRPSNGIKAVLCCGRETRPRPPSQHSARKRSEAQASKDLLLRP
jgi:hypothetical protein